LEREREEVIKILTNGVSWKQSCGDDHTLMLNRGGGGALMGRWFGCEEERLEPEWVQWIIGVLWSRLL
jgi:hypothetical protein